MSILEHLNPSQREAVTMLDGPVMIVAGAGSGKTRVLTYRIAYLIETGVSPDTILALTFTNKAAGEMKTRIESLVGQHSRQVWAGTFHSIFARILRMECHYLGYTRSFSIYDADDTVALVKDVMASVDVSAQQFSPQSIASLISKAKNEFLSPRAVRQQAQDPFQIKSAIVYEEYQRRLKRSNAMDFDDLLVKSLELFGKFPAILERYQYRFKHILVDEFQDTNRVQYRLTQELARRHNNICVVGDDAQSIYSFRGADIRNILDFERDYPHCRVLCLEQNYRSSRNILAAANSLIRNNAGQIPKELWTENDEGELLALERCEDERDEGYRIATRVEEESLHHKYDLRSFAVLYRTNAQSRPIEDALRRRGLPYTIVGSVAFYKRKEIKDVLAYLTLLANPYDEGSLLRIINVPPRGIGSSTQTKLRVLSQRSGLSLFDLLDSEHHKDSIPARTRESLAALSSMMKKYISLKEEMSLSELARSLVEETGVLSLLKEENTAESLARRDNIQELISALTEFTDTKPGATLQDFLEEVSLVSEVDTADFGRNAVTLMTLHAAKGLEFPVVFVAGLEEGICPLSSSIGDDRDLEEERRLLYVGMTRAMRNLYLSYASMRYRYGESSFMVRSRFLDEIDPRYFRNVEEPLRHRGGERMSRKDPMLMTRARSRRPVDDIPPDDRSHVYEDESQEVISPRVGLRVLHESFGKGRIVALQGEGENARAVVDFESVGRKHLLLKFARLKVM
jgi:DNA helicase-2/ATP-dependent DNA helicase PcrA